MAKPHVIFGLHAVESALRNDPENVLTIYCKSNRKDQRFQKILTLANELQVRVQLVEEKECQRRAGDKNHQGVVAEYKTVALAGESDLFSLVENIDGPPFLLVLDGVTDPHNLGACLRTADAAGVHAVVLPKDNAVGMTPVVRKVASGAAEVVPVFQVTNLARTLEQLQSMGIWIVGTTDATEQTLYSQDLKGPLAIVMGSEGKGMRQRTEKLCDFLVRIPMLGQVESLNISVATAVCLYEALRQRGGVG